MARPLNSDSMLCVGFSRAAIVRTSSRSGIDETGRPGALGFATQRLSSATRGWLGTCGGACKNHDPQGPAYEPHRGLSYLFTGNALARPQDVRLHGLILAHSGCGATTPAVKLRVLRVRAWCPVSEELQVLPQLRAAREVPYVDERARARGKYVDVGGADVDWNRASKKCLHKRWGRPQNKFDRSAWRED